LSGWGRVEPLADATAVLSAADSSRPQAVDDQSPLSDTRPASFRVLEGEPFGTRNPPNKPASNQKDRPEHRNGKNRVQRETR
jgi:hypothetical protein